MNQRHAFSAVAITGLLAVIAALVALPRLGDVTGPYGPPAGARTVLVDGGDLLGVSLSFYVDHLSAVVLLLAAGVGLLVQVYSTAYLAGDPRYRSYTVIIQLFLVAMALVVVADNLWVLLIGWEVMGLCSYLLISHHWELSDARSGAVKAFLLTRIGDLGLLVGIIAIGATFGTYEISGVLAAMADGEDVGSLTGIGLLLVLAAVAKSAQFPLHSWLPDAMPGPTPISALIHAATMVAAGVFLLARLYPVVVASEVTTTVLAAIAVITMLMAALFALTAGDLKRVLAWSTVSQLAYMFAALAVGGYDAGIDHLLSHGAFKALLFLAAGSVAHAIGSTALRDMGGLRRSMPLTFATATIGFAALAGLLPTVGFFSKDAVLDSAWHAIRHDAPVSPLVAVIVLVVGLVTAAVTVVYCARTWWSVFFTPVEAADEQDRVASSAKHAAPAATHAATTAKHAAPVTVGPGHEAPGAMAGPLLLLAAATLLLSFAMPLHPLAGLVTMVIVVGVGWLCWRALREGSDPVAFVGLRPGRSRAESASDDAWAWTSRAAARSGDGVVATDRDIVDFYPRAVGWLTMTTGRLMSRAQSGNAQAYATVLAVGVLLVAVGAVVR
ncbi:NADH-quinone oxidoreductase subunit L [Mumia flava]|uniref:NADH-quinone oxidoreductase subunit L n=1 Tax=Mumia flava TaxID=1348852 RepID=A0A2M9BJZ2_9ACTN|nr:proton-conducting transporter membrane subunit [Mumia flava]PJJ58273.1 NADH-quinone oxidoreductase subunit L [Mumia flava]